MERYNDDVSFFNIVNQNSKQKDKQEWWLEKFLIKNKV